MKVEGGHCLSVKAQNLAEADEIIGEGGGLPRFEGSQLVGGECCRFRCHPQRKSSSVPEFFENISGLVFKVHVEHC